MFFQGAQTDFIDGMVQIALSDNQNFKQVREHTLKKLGLDLLQAMVIGEHFLLDLGMLSPNFNTVYCDADSFPADQIFDNDRTRALSSLEPLFRASDKISSNCFSGENAPSLHPGFMLVVRSCVEDQDDLLKVLNCIPHIESFLCLRVISTPSD